MKQNQLNTEIIKVDLLVKKFNMNVTDHLLGRMLHYNQLKLSFDPINKKFSVKAPDNYSKDYLVLVEKYQDELNAFIKENLSIETPIRQNKPNESILTEPEDCVVVAERYRQDADVVKMCVSLTAAYIRLHQQNDYIKDLEERLSYYEAREIHESAEKENMEKG